MDWQATDNLIDQFENMIHEDDGIAGALTVFIPGHSWGDKWRKAAEIQDAFNSKVRYPTKDQQEEAWKRFNELRSELAERSKAQQDQNKQQSNWHRSQILQKVESAKPDQFFGFSLIDINQMKALGEVLNEAASLLTENKSEMIGEHKQECFEAIREMRKEHDIWWSKLREEKNQHHADFESRTRNNLEQNYERLRKAKDALERFRGQADELRSDIANAWSDEWRERREGWLAELEDRIEDVEASIERIEKWIGEDEEKLR